MTAIEVELQVDYIRALVERLRGCAPDKDAGALCTRIEANLDTLMELLTDPPAIDPRIVDRLRDDPELTAILLDADEPEPEPTAEAASDHASDMQELAAAVAAVTQEHALADAKPEPPVARWIGLPMVETHSTVEEMPPDPAAAAAATPRDPLAAVNATRSPRKGRPIGPATSVCEPGCGQTIPTGPAFGEHRRNCEAYRAHVAAHTVDHGGRREPAPLPEDVVDVVAEREAYQARRTANARAKAEETWARRHGGEERPAAAERGPYGPRDPDGLTTRQREVMDALRTSEGRVREAARALGMNSSGPVSGQISALRATDRLPADVEKLLTARRNERLGVKDDA